MERIITTGNIGRFDFSFLVNFLFGYLRGLQAGREVRNLLKTTKPNRQIMPKRGAGLETDNKIILSSKGRCLCDTITDMKMCQGYLPKDIGWQPQACVWLDEWDLTTCLRFEL